jgi:uncharacterized cupredoxin-like copper-binding protein
VFRRFGLGLGLAAVVVVAGLAMACSSGDSSPSADQQAVADLTVRLAGTNGPDADEAAIDFYMAHVTDQFVQAFGTESVEACRAAAAECIGDALPNPHVDPADVSISGDTAKVKLVSDQGSFGVNLVRNAADWQADSFFVVNDNIPSGVNKVDLGLNEFAFTFDASDSHVTSGKFAFHVKNNGQQTHEVAMLKLPEGVSLQDAMASDNPNVEFITFKFPFQPGDEADMVVPELSAGRYALVCFLPDTTDPQGTPHAFKGMTSEFTVQ